MRRVLAVAAISFAGCDQVFGITRVFDARPDDVVDGHTDATDATADATPDADPTRCTSDLACLTGTVTTFVCGGQCYATCSASVSALAAESQCAAWGGSLASLETEVDSSCVEAKLPAASGIHWLGLHQADGASSPASLWRWADMAEFNYADWIGGDPNDVDTIENAEEQCAFVGSIGWGDIKCANTIPVLCERSLP